MAHERRDASRKCRYKFRVNGMVPNRLGKPTLLFSILVRGSRFLLRDISGPMKADRSAARSRVLIVDDDRDTREMYSQSLRADGFELRTASTAQEALRAARAFLPAVVVTDLRLHGGIDGFELTKLLRADNRMEEVRIIMLTGATLGGERERATASGVDLFVVKPCLPTTLASVIRRVSSASSEVL